MINLKQMKFSFFVCMLENKFGNNWLLGLTPTERIENMNRLIQAIDDASTPNDLFSTSVTFMK
jgi:hypothetical protein